MCVTKYSMLQIRENKIHIYREKLNSSSPLQLLMLLFFKSYFSSNNRERMVCNRIAFSGRRRGIKTACYRYYKLMQKCKKIRGGQKAIGTIIELEKDLVN